MPPSLQTGPAGFAHAANAARNAQATWWRTARWHSARTELWRLLKRHLPSRAVVAVVGAGNAHDVPLHRLARHAHRVDLIDLDEVALRRAKRRPLTRRRLHGIVEDITLGAADAITHAVVSGQPARHRPPPPRPIGHTPYDVVVADLLFTQLLYPALADAALTGPAIDAALLRHAQPLTDSVVARLHASTPDGLLIHVHDILGWWPGHPQPFKIDDVLALAQHDTAAALELAQTGTVPYGSDPRDASQRLGAEILDTALWRWPFAPTVDYLICATVTRTHPPRDTTPPVDDISPT